MGHDFPFILLWWLVLFLVGGAALPLTTLLFANFFDRGYIFSKILGMLALSYIVFLFGSIKLLPFTQTAIFFVLALLVTTNIFLVSKYPNILISLKKSWKIILFEEILFLGGLVFWSYIRAHEPSIHGLEKYMDQGFVNSILRSEYFPPTDMWYTPHPINYYYFGHLVTAVLTKLSGIASFISYNLMIATLFAFTFTGVFSIALNLFVSMSSKLYPIRHALYALLTAFLATLAGNLHPIYAFFKSYNTDSPVPFWQLPFLAETFPNGYWYPNATRFIINTIHEFPLYSFVVSDLHGHVLDIPVVLLTIALLFSLIQNAKIKMQNDNSKIENLLEIGNWKLEIPLLSFLIAVMYMTNIWDSLIYFLLTALVFAYLGLKTNNLYKYLKLVVLVGIGSIIFALPFSLHFKPFASGIGVLCAPEFLTNMGKLGPFLFEPDHCQRSPLYQLFILYGFFYFFVFVFLVSLFRKLKAKRNSINTSEVFVVLLILISTLLIIAPELIYAKDIYPAHYRANTMFKLGYQAFIMLSIVAGFVIMRYATRKLIYLLLVTCLLLLVGIYPYFAVGAYYENLENYRGLNGIAYLQKSAPADYEAIHWINQNIQGQPVILEAQGDSYTDYARISSHTGLPTVIGWPVHEWLWRGSYDVAAPRITDVQTLYETGDLTTAQELIKRYKIELIFIGDLERQKYPNLSEDKFGQLGNIIYENDQTRIYQIGQ